MNPSAFTDADSDTSQYQMEERSCETAKDRHRAPQRQANAYERSAVVALCEFGNERGAKCIKNRKGRTTDEAELEIRQGKLCLHALLDDAEEKAIHDRKPIYKCQEYEDVRLVCGRAILGYGQPFPRKWVRAAPAIRRRCDYRIASSSDR